LNWLGALRLPATLLFPLFGQALLYNPDPSRANVPLALAFFAFGLLMFAAVVRREKLLTGARVVALGENQPLTLRRVALGVAGVSAVLTFVLAGNHLYTPVLLVAWVICLVAWWLAAAQLPDPGNGRAALERALASARQGAFTVHVSGLTLLLLAALAVGAYFRFNDLDALPPEMTSDHVEKLLDVGDIVLDENYKIFFQRNTGREPLQFYWTAWLAGLLGTGLTHLSLKIGTALFGFLTLPFIFLLGRELEDDRLGLIAVTLAAVAFWATVISRVGLRFPLSPVFVAPVLYFLFRGLRRNSRNDFLLAGLMLGVGLHGYTPFRVMPLVVLALAGLYLLWPEARGRRWNVCANTALLAVTAFVVFLPLARYAYDQPENFWYRTNTRWGDTERELFESEMAQDIRLNWQARFGADIPAPALTALVFLQNQWNALLVFNYRGDVVWVNTLNNRPVLDTVTAALLVLGAGYLLARLLFRRDWVAAALFLAALLLMLPSTLALAFPNENPSVVRLGGAIPIIFVMAAYPLWLLLKRAEAPTAGAGRGSWAAGLVTLALLLVGALALNQDMYFRQYREQYLSTARTASEVGQVIRGFAASVGSYETAWVRPYPHWVDTRAVGMYAGNFRRDYALPFEELADTQAVAGPKLFIFNLQDTEVRPDGEPATLPELRRLYPNGQLSTFTSQRPDNKDFLIYSVPASSAP
jgi:hypothetical protein